MVGGWSFFRAVGRSFDLRLVTFTTDHNRARDRVQSRSHAFTKLPLTCVSGGGTKLFYLEVRYMQKYVVQFCSNSSTTYSICYGLENSIGRTRRTIGRSYLWEISSQRCSPAWLLVSDATSPESLWLPVSAVYRLQRMAMEFEPTPTSSHSVILIADFDWSQR